MRSKSGSESGTRDTRDTYPRYRAPVISIEDVECLTKFRLGVRLLVFVHQLHKLREINDAVACGKSVNTVMTESVLNA